MDVFEIRQESDTGLLDFWRSTVRIDGRPISVPQMVATPGALEFCEALMRFTVRLAGALRQPEGARSVEGFAVQRCRVSEPIAGDYHVIRLRPLAATRRARPHAKHQNRKQPRRARTRRP